MAITQTQFHDMMDRALHPFQQDLIDGTHTSGSPQAITAGTPVRFSIDGATRNELQRPSYMTDSWDTSNNKISAASEYDGYEYVANLGWTFDPTTAASGIATVRVWIDDATPKEVGTYQVAYKGPDANKGRVVTTWYWGTETGYDAKNDGVYFTIEFDDNGSLYDKSLRIYNTQ